VIYIVHCLRLGMFDYVESTQFPNILWYLCNGQTVMTDVWRIYLENLILFFLNLLACPLCPISSTFPVFRSFSFVTEFSLQVKARDEHVTHLTTESKDFVAFRNLLISFWRVVNPPANSQVEGPHIVSCPQLLFNIFAQNCWVFG
jgi:hypothetical protein